MILAALRLTPTERLRRADASHQSVMELGSLSRAARRRAQAAEPQGPRLETPPDQLDEMYALLYRHGVEFIIVGVSLEGGLPLALRVDICYSRTASNIARLASALAEVSPKRRGDRPGAPPRFHAGAIKRRSSFMVDTAFGYLALRGQVRPNGRYEKVRAHAERHDRAGFPVLVIGRDDRIRVNQHVQRARDELMHMRQLAVDRNRARKLCQDRGALLNPP